MFPGRAKFATLGVQGFNFARGDLICPAVNAN
jgi:hypothetical protein